MRTEMEKMHRDLEKYLDARGGDNLSDEQFSNALDNFVKQYNESLRKKPTLTTATAKTADDFLELAEMADSDKNRIKYLKKAIALEPDNIDAQIDYLSATVTDTDIFLDRLGALKKKAEEGSMAEFLENDMGDFYGIVETRPYMRLCFTLLQVYAMGGFWRLAVEEAKWILKLNKDDNLGARYYLIFLDSMLGDEKGAKQLARKYKYDMQSTRFLLAFSMLYYYLRDLDKAFEYAGQLKACNKDIGKFTDIMVEGNKNLSELLDPSIPEDAYQPDTGSDLYALWSDMPLLFVTRQPYFYWLQNSLKQMH